MRLPRSRLKRNSRGDHVKYFVTGRVHPERADINFGRLEVGTIESSRIVARCESSQLSLLLEGPEINGYVTAFLAAEHFARTVVSIIGFVLGSGYSIEIIQVSDEAGNSNVFGVRPTNGTPPVSLGFDPHGPIFERAFRLAGKDLFFRLALQDFVRAIVEVLDCATLCYRAIEAIKSALVFRTGIDSWQPMHDALGTDEVTIRQNVKNFADPVRHGNWAGAVPTDVNTRWNMLSFTRDILVRYIDYNQLEDAAEHPNNPP